ncbi:preprotein translocase subunit SecG [Marinibaculum pumilum]|uniref:Protein-export membrane protein SecG n=1 Tax=Marinibaculum pumilum TaxID=1766165 RepID=A0ABV7KU82_9PROT
MITIVLILHLIFAVALIGVVLLQRSEGGALGIGGGGGGGGGLVSSRGAASFLTRTTGALAACFIATSLALAILAQQSAGPPRSILDGAGGARPASERLTPLGNDAAPGPAGDTGAGQDGGVSAPVSGGAGTGGGSESLTPLSTPDN